jgi:hypothetical protein
VVRRNCIKYEYWKCAYLWTENWSVAMKSPGPRAFRPVMMTWVAVVVALFFAAINHCDAIGGRSPSSSLGSSNVCGRSSNGRGWSSAESIARQPGRVHGVAGERAWRLGTSIRRVTTTTTAAYNHKSACRCMHIYMA